MISRTILPNLTLTGRDFTLAEPPRVEPPWG